MPKRLRFETHDFYCINCGEKMFPLPRKCNKKKEKFHRKKMYCIHCKNEINAVECRTMAEVEEFKEDFKAGLYIEEAKESIEFVKNEGGII